MLQKNVHSYFRDDSNYINTHTHAKINLEQNVQMSYTNMNYFLFKNRFLYFWFPLQ